MSIGMVLIFLAATPTAEVVQPQLARRATLTVKVTDPAAAADTLVAKAEALGGYFSARSDDSVRLRVPTSKLEALLAAIAPLGVVVAREQAADDVSQRRQELRTLLGSYEEVLARYFAVIKSATPDSVVTVEREMTRLVQSIESTKGELTLLEHRVRMADVQVSFAFRDRRPPARDGSSSFPWLNTVNVADLIEEFARAN
jgi:hypothetical protein